MRHTAPVLETAAKILIVGGMLNLVLGLVTGYLFSRVRRSAPEAPHYLVTAHVGAFMTGAMQLGLVFAIALSDLSSGLETLAAWLIVIGSALIGAANLMHWSQGVTDQFAEKPLGYYLSTAQAVLVIIGIGILTVGVFRGL